MGSSSVPWSAVLALAGAGWYFIEGFVRVRAPRRAAAKPPRRAKCRAGRQGRAPAASLDEVLEKARLAMDERRYIEPAKNNALEHFRQVLVLDPKNAEATEGLKRLGGLLIARARTALDERRFDNALAELEAARSIDPERPATGRSRRPSRLDARADRARADPGDARRAELRSRADAARSRAEGCAAAARADRPALEGTRRQAPLRDGLSPGCQRRSASGQRPPGDAADESAKDAIKALREAGASDGTGGPPQCRSEPAPAGRGTRRRRAR